MVADKAKRTKAEAGSTTGSRLWVTAAVTILSGALLGLSAPGIEQWYLAWFGLVPLFLLVAQAPNIKQSFIRGFCFGLAYNLVYLNWYLHLHPLRWMGFEDWQSLIMSAVIWVAVSCHQGLITALFSLLLKVLPLTGGIIPRPVDGKWKLPALLVIPLLWVLIHNKIGNHPDFLGVPWSMLEYSQYMQLPLMQSASLIGGIGIGFIIVAANTTIASLIATLFKKQNWQSFAMPSFPLAIINVLMISLIVTNVYIWGQSRMAVAPADRDAPSLTVSLLQPNIGIDMLRPKPRFSFAQLLAKYGKLVAACPKGLAVLHENALPTYLKDDPRTQQFLMHIAHERGIDIILGGLDSDKRKHPYNSAFGITKNGTLLDSIYHKRFLVPFGEYTPDIANYLPDVLRKLTSTPAGRGLIAGKRPVMFYMPSGLIAPNICFEAIAPEISAESVRSGGTLIVNLCDLTWFHNSMIGDQMLAFATVRAIETKRYLVMAANTGPSAIIDPLGRMEAKTGMEQSAVLTGHIAFIHDMTPFASWFR